MSFSIYRSAFALALLGWLLLASVTEAQYKRATVLSFSTTSNTFVDVPGGALDFKPASTGEIWILLFSAKLASTSFASQSPEVRYLVNGVEHGIGGASSNPSNERDMWQHFYRVTGTTASQNVRVQLRDVNSATATLEDLRIVAFRLPPGADFQFIDNETLRSLPAGGFNDVETLSFTPSSAGNYVVMAVANGHEDPGMSYIAARLQAPDSSFWPVDHDLAQADLGHFEWGRRGWRSFFLARVETLDAAPKSYRLQALGDPTNGSEILYTRLMAFRTSAFESVESDQDLTALSTTSTTPVVLSTVNTSAPPGPRDYIVLQSVFLWAAGSTTDERRAGFERDDVVQSSIGQITNNVRSSVSYSLFDGVTTSSSVKYENTFSTSNVGYTVNAKESVIHVLRLPTCSPSVNFRSIGRNGGTLASAGTATVNVGETKVTFTNPLPQPTAVGAVGPGDRLVIGGETLYILSRDSDTQVSVQTPALANHSAAAYTVTRAFSGATPIQDWENGRGGDLVAENRREVGVSYKDAALPFEENVTIDGSTTDACRFLWLTVADGQRHGGVAASSPSDHVVLNPTAAGNAFTVRDDFTRIDKFEVKGWTGASAEAVRIEAFDLLFDQMLVHDDVSTGGDGDGFFIGDGVSYTATIRNTIVYNVARTGIRIEQSAGGGNPVLTLENVTVYNCGSGTVSNEGGVLLMRATGDPVIHAKNVVSVGNRCGGGCTDPDFKQAGVLPVNWGTSTNNLSSDGSARGPSPITGRSAGTELLSTTPGSENLHLRFGAVATDSGVDLSAQFFRDIDGQSRLGLTWDRGADEAFCKVYWTEEAVNAIRRADLDGSNPETLLTFAPATEIPRGLALHVAGGKMYWAEGGTKIRRANLDGSGLQDVVTGLSLPRDVDVDPVAGKIYWVDQNTSKIQRANLDGTGIQDLVTGVSVSRAGPALDLVNGKMYWTEDGSNKIRRANLDGTGVQDLVTTGLLAPFGIALDVAAGKMYWTDLQTDKIQRANLDGTGVEDLITTGLLDARGIDLDPTNGKMYWVDYGAGKLQRANLDGTGVEDLFTLLDSPNGVALGCPVAAPTAVALTSFTAAAGNAEVLVSWETGSEWNNLGFHLYRSRAPVGPYDRVTAQAIPGLGSSPVGARYWYRDRGLENGVTYYYKLEDIESTGRTTLHGPVLAQPSETAPPSEEPGSGESPLSAARIQFGAPEANGLSVTHRGRDLVELELLTRGFYASALDDGTVALEIPDFVTLEASMGPSMPVRRAWIELGAEGKVEVLSVRAGEVRAIGGLRPASLETTPYATTTGVVRLSRATRRALHSPGAGLVPADEARVLEEGFQGGLAKALVELAPLRWDSSSGRLLLAERLVVRLKVSRKASRRRREESPQTVWHLATTDPGLYAVPYESLASSRRGSVPVESIALRRLGEAVPFHVEPSRERFGPGSVLYFLSDGEKLNPYGREAVFELAWTSGGKRMALTSARPWDEGTRVYRHRIEREENRLYQPALLRAPDMWLWEALFAPASKSFAFEVSSLVESLEPARLEVWLQGTSDFPVSSDHHVRVLVNEVFVAEAYWDGKMPHRFDVTLPAGLLREGANRLEIENVGGTGAAYSMVMLDRFAVTYPRRAHAVDGELRGRFTESRAAEVGGVTDAVVVDVTDGECPRWLTGLERGPDDRVRFRVEAGREYGVFGASAVRAPVLRRVGPYRLRDRTRRADLVVLGPREFQSAALPLLERRREEGLEVLYVAVEDVFVEFGHGETRPEAIRDFLAFAYHEWPAPSLRYVLLLGDATLDFKDHYGLGIENRVPPLMVPTSFLTTASDPTYAMVRGDDRLPDLAIGRLPAADAEEAKRLVAKVLAYETSGVHLGGSVVLVADNADHAGNFEAHAEELAGKLLAGREVRKIYLSRLGVATTRQAIRESFGEGPSLMSYLGHGGIHVWADENLFDRQAVSGLEVQAQMPVLLTMNCLNGYFHFPFFDSLSETLLKAEERGVIAAFSPSGLTLDAPAHRYHEALLNEILHGSHQRLGDAILAAQESYSRTGAYSELLTIFHLLGDPTLPLR